MIKYQIKTDIMQKINFQTFDASYDFIIGSTLQCPLALKFCLNQLFENVAFYKLLISDLLTYFLIGNIKQK